MKNFGKYNSFISNENIEKVVETYLKSSISGVRSWDSLDESQKAADPAWFTGALLPMEVPIAANFQ